MGGASSAEIPCTYAAGIDSNQNEQLHSREDSVRVDVRVLVIEADDEPEKNLVWAHVIQEAAAVVLVENLGLQRPAECMLNKAARGSERQARQGWGAW